ncbi:hypothetical protein [Flavobacterium sp.]|uniref:hypothetical protein n=1 Tax=Flavobacterium sp. TaxID=239 RepID=UPI003D6B6B90
MIQQHISKEKTEKKAANAGLGVSAVQLKDNRGSSVIQKKLSDGVSKIENNPGLGGQTVQRVLKDKKNSAAEAQLIKEYHTAEDNGNNISITSTNIDHQKQAVIYYKSAIQKRKRVGKMHVDQDGGHLAAVDTLKDKIQARQAKIKGLEMQKKTGKKPKLPGLNYK